MKILLLLVLLLTPAFGQDRAVSVKLRDTSPSNNLIEFSGKINFSEHRANGESAITREGRIALKNTSGRQIVAVAVNFSLLAFQKPADSISYNHDWFFKHHGLAPGDTVEIPIPMSVHGPHKTPPFPEEPSYLNAELQFVEFDDGTSWGDPESAPVLLKGRQTVQAFLEELTNIYLTQGETAFVKRIKDGQKGATALVASNLALLLEHSSAEIVLQDVKARLQTAAARRVKENFDALPK